MNELIIRINRNNFNYRAKAVEENNGRKFHRKSMEMKSSFNLLNVEKIGSILLFRVHTSDSFILERTRKKDSSRIAWIHLISFGSRQLLTSHYIYDIIVLLSDRTFWRQVVCSILLHIHTSNQPSSSLLYLDLEIAHYNYYCFKIH